MSDGESHRRIDQQRVSNQNKTHDDIRARGRLERRTVLQQGDQQQSGLRHEETSEDFSRGRERGEEDLVIDDSAPQPQRRDENDRDSGQAPRPPHVRAICGEGCEQRHRDQSDLRRPYRFVVAPEDVEELLGGEWQMHGDHTTAIAVAFGTARRSFRYLVICDRTSVSWPRRRWPPVEKPMNSPR